MSAQGGQLSGGCSATKPRGALGPRMRKLAADAWRMARREPSFVFGLALAALILLVALFPGLFTGKSPTAINTANAFMPPSAGNWFGTDDTGRDLYARTIYGTRVTLSIVAGSLLLSAILGGFFGLVAGYVRGATDMAAGRIVDVMLSFPPIILGVVITGVLGPGIRNLMLALSIVYIPIFFRIARSGALSEVERTYVEAARSVGLSGSAILFGHVMRNVLPLIMLQYVILFPLILQIQAALGFLGLGVQPPTPDWGAILEQGKDYILYAPWISFFPGLFILFSALAVMLIGRGIQKRVDIG